MTNAQSHCRSAATRQLVSSAVTTGLPRTVAHKAAYVGCAWRAARWMAWTSPPRVIVSPKRSRSSARDLAVGQAEAFVQEHGEARRPAGPAARRPRRAHRRSAADGGPARAGGTAAAARSRRGTRARRAAARAALPDTAWRSARGARRPTQCGHRGGSGASYVSSTCAARRRCARAPIRRPGLRPGRRGAAARAARERRRLAIHRATRRVELVFQFVVFAPQPLPLRFRPAQILAQPLDSRRLLVDDLLRVAGRRRSSRRHAPVMPDSRAQYKSEMMGQPR